jgi:Kae1-associated kinase Bud32
LIIEYISGKKISENLENLSLREQKNIMKDLGNQIAKLHNNNIIHGDLTTSNFIINEKGKIYIIDFGLSFISIKIEDKANDIYLLKQALKTKHSKNFEFLFKEFLDGYSKKAKEVNKILERLQIIEKRGRYKEK